MTHPDLWTKSATERMLDVIEKHRASYHGVLPTLDSSITFEASSAEELARRFASPPTTQSPVYGRMLQPSVGMLGEMLSALEGSEAGYGVASGLSAIHIVVNELAKPGDHIVVGDTLYAGSVGYFTSLPNERGVSVTKVGLRDEEAVARALATPRTKLLYCESVTNPLLEVTDIPRLASLAHHVGVPLVVDNTFAPFSVQPVKHGADIVLHSLTKYAGGYSDLIAGGICSSREFFERILHPSSGLHTQFGAVLDATLAHRLVVRMQDMHLRFREASWGAYTLTELLSGRGISVLYPGLPSDPMHPLMRKLITPEATYCDYGYGGVFSLDLGSYDKATDFHRRLCARSVAMNAVSLGSVHTYAVCLGNPSAPPPPSCSWGNFRQIPAGLIRVAVGRSPEPAILLRRFSGMLDEYLS